MAGEHTPNPWIVEELIEAPGFYCVRGEVDGIELMTAPADCTSMKPLTEKMAKQLTDYFANRSALLEACQAAVLVLSANHMTKQSLITALEKCNAAIKGATGGDNGGN